MRELWNYGGHEGESIGSIWWTTDISGKSWRDIFKMIYFLIEEFF